MMKRLLIRSKKFGPEVNWDIDLDDTAIASYLALNQAKYGLPDREVPESMCTPEEIAMSLSNRLTTDPVTGGQVKLYTLPATYTITIVDIQADLDAEVAKRSQIQTLKQAVKTILQKADTDVTTAEVKAALLKFLRASLLKGDLD
jgi:hypothetical protein